MRYKQLAQAIFLALALFSLVDDPAGRSNENLPSYRDSIGVVLDEDNEQRASVRLPILL